MTRSYTTVCLAFLALGVSGATPARAAPAVRVPAAAVSDADLAPGRALFKKGRWGEAVAAFERVVASAPDDARALSELGWAAFNAGDHRKARTALERSIQLASDPRVKGASLYSLGRVEEAAGRRDLAARRYRESLGLRPSRIVDRQLRGLADEGVEPLPIAQPAGERPAFCTEPRALEDVCACVSQGMRSEARDEPVRCELLQQPALIGFRVIAARRGTDGTLFLVQAAREHGWAVTDVIASFLDDADYGLKGVDGGGLRGGRALRLIVRTRGHHESAGSQDGWSHEEETEVYCVVVSPEARTRCTLAVPVSIFDEQYTFGARPTEQREETTMRVDLAEDGVAQVVLVKGVAPEEEGLLGVHRLW